MAKLTAAEAKKRAAVLKRLRTICLKFPETTEAASFGNPAFRAGKRPFVVLDRYKGADCLFFYVESGLRDELLTQPHFFKAPYDPKGKGICRDLEKIDWTEIKSLALGSYKAVANQRMLKALR